MYWITKERKKKMGEKGDTVDSRITVIEGRSSGDVVRREGEEVKSEREEIGRALDLIGEFSMLSPFRLSSFPSRSYLHYPSHLVVPRRSIGFSLSPDGIAEYFGSISRYPWPGGETRRAVILARLNSISLCLAVLWLPGAEASSGHVHRGCSR